MVHQLDLYSFPFAAPTNGTARTGLNREKIINSKKTNKSKDAVHALVITKVCSAT